jgi:hypothetical protein
MEARVAKENTNLKRLINLYESYLNHPMHRKLRQTRTRKQILSGQDRCRINQVSWPLAPSTTGNPLELGNQHGWNAVSISHTDQKV